MAHESGDERACGYDAAAHQRQATENYAGLYRSDLAEAFDRLEVGRSCPPPGADPLEYLGALEPLQLSPGELADTADSTAALIARNGEAWVWSNRRRLKMETAFIYGDPNFVSEIDTATSRPRGAARCETWAYRAGAGLRRVLGVALPGFRESARQPPRSRLW